MSVIALLTDFGTRDHFAGAMKGVIQQIAPQATILDVSHEVEPFNVLHAAFVLRQVWSWWTRVWARGDGFSWGGMAVSTWWPRTMA